MKRFDNTYNESLVVPDPVPPVVYDLKTEFGFNLSDLFEPLVYIPFNDSTALGKDLVNGYDFIQVGGGNLEVSSTTSAPRYSPVQFDGVRYLAHYSPSLLNEAITNKFTLGLWFKYPSTPTGDKCLWSYNIDSSVGSGIKLVIGSDGKLRIQSSIENSVDFEFKTDSTIDSNWHQVVFVVTTSGNALYMDGIISPVTYSVGNSSSSGMANPGSNAKWFLGSLNGADNYDGEMDDMFLSTRVYSASDVEYVYNKATSSKVFNTMSNPLLLSSLELYDEPSFYGFTTGTRSVSHNIPAARFLCNNIVVMKGGLVQAGAFGIITIPKEKPGLYLVHYDFVWFANATGDRYCWIVDQDDVIHGYRKQPNNGASGTVPMNATCVIYHNGLQDMTLEIQQFQDSGGSLFINENVRVACKKLL